MAHARGNLIDLSASSSTSDDDSQEEVDGPNTNNGDERLGNGKDESAKKSKVRRASFSKVLKLAGQQN